MPAEHQTRRFALPSSGLMLSEDSPEVDRFVGENNDKPKPIVWTAGSERVLAAVKRGKEALESIH